MSDHELNGPRTADALARLGHEASLVAFRRQGVLYYVVLVQTEDDAATHNASEPDKPATREAWQRANIVLAIGDEINRVLWDAEHRSLPDSGVSLTLWFERTASRYDVGPVARRHGASGRPEWATRVSDSPLILPFDA